MWQKKDQQTKIILFQQKLSLGFFLGFYSHHKSQQGSVSLTENACLIFCFCCDQQITTLSLARNIKAVRFTSDGQKVHSYILSKEVLLSSQGFHKCFQHNADWFSQANKTIRTELLYEKNSLSPRLSNQTYQIIVTAGQYGKCPALTEIT